MGDSAKRMLVAVTHRHTGHVVDLTAYDLDSGYKIQDNHYDGLASLYKAPHKPLKIIDMFKKNEKAKQGPLTYVEFAKRDNADFKALLAHQSELFWAKVKARNEEGAGLDTSAVKKTLEKADKETCQEMFAKSKAK